MASKSFLEPRKTGELVLIVGTAALILIFGVVVAGGFPGGNGSGVSSAGGGVQPSPSSTSAHPSPTAGRRERPTYDPEVTPDTWVPAEQYPGVPAIQPSVDTAAPGEPRITVDDIEAYVAERDYIDEIVSIEFLPAHVVEERFDEAPGAYAGRLLCVVDLRGSFNISLPPEVQEKLRKEGRTLEITRMIQIFDALTGNLLSETMPRS